MKLILLVLGLTFLTLCRPETEDDKKNWWKKHVIYQIYPRSFMDSNNDGIGDLKGIESKLDYIKELGIGSTWLSPIYKSPMKDFGYDISNYTAIEPIFGTMADFDSYLKKSHEKGLKVIMDFVPNHSSNESEWFKKSEKRIEPYTDYYIWKDGINTPTGPKPPNNWLSIFGGGAWEWSPIRRQFYYHVFLKEQPDLNYRNPKLREEMKNVLRFWLNKGVDGFRIDAIPWLFEDPQWRDEQKFPWDQNKPDLYEYYNHSRTFDLPEVLDVIAEWRNVFQEYEKRDGLHRLMMLETALDFKHILRYFGNDTRPLADLPFNFGIILNITGNNITGHQVYNTVVAWCNQLPKNKWANWVLGNHDQHRIGNRTHVDLRDAFNMMSLLLRGTPITYYGEEIGMVDTFISWDQVQDPYGKWFGPQNYTKYDRDPERTPMQWDDSKFAGFTNGKTTWLPVNNNSRWLNVKAQKTQRRSHLKTYLQLVALKKEKAILNGTVDFPIISKEIFSFTRTVKNSPGYVVIINFGNVTKNVDLSSIKTAEFSFPTFGFVMALSDKLMPMNTAPFGITLRQIILPPRQSIVIRFSPIWNH